MKRLAILIFLLIFFSPSAVLAQNTQAPSITRKVIVLNFDPVLENYGSVRLTDYYNWNNPDELVSGYIQSLFEATQGMVNYELVDWIDIDGYPDKIDGFSYTDDTYIGCWSGSSACHSPDELDYRKVLADYGICDMRNQDQIHELWLMGGPYFGFWEAIMAGPEGFWTNGSPLDNTGCEKQLHIMGFNYEREVQQMVHNMGHRVEGTMTHLYGGWQQNRTANEWEKFALVDAQSPDYNYSGCGSVHYPPNGNTDYDYTNQSPNQSTCLDWLNYPNLTDNATQIDCTSWGCGNYEEWWLSFIPKYAGETNNKWNNWWYYVLDYETALSAFQPTTSPTPATATPTPQPTATPIPGDGDMNGVVDGIDYIIWLNNYNSAGAGPSEGDYDNSGFVDGVDYVVWLNNYT